MQLHYLSFAAILAGASVLLTGSQSVRAEFKVGAEIPDFKLKSAEDGSTFSVAGDHGNSSSRTAIGGTPRKC
jgi:hypothetical protein